MTTCASSKCLVCHPEPVVEPYKEEVFMGADPLRARTDTTVFAVRTPPPETILDEAKRLVYGPREASYAHPSVDFKRAVGALNAIFEPKLKEPFTETDWALVMIICKLARQAHSPSRDGWVDAAGYAATGARVQGIDP